MSWYRVFSTMVNDDNEDNKTNVILHVKIADDKKIDNRVQVFGYSQEWTEELNSYQKYPFILQFDSQEKINGKIDFGGWDADANNRLNIFDKEIKENELFTYFLYLGDHTEEYTYRIENVTKI